MLKLIKKYQNQRYQENKKNFDKVHSFLQQVKQGLYIGTICQRSLYQRGVKLCKNEKYKILTPELYHPVKSFDEKLYYVKLVISILIKMKFHVKHFAIKWQ